MLVMDAEFANVTIACLLSNKNSWNSVILEVLSVVIDIAA